MSGKRQSFAWAHEQLLSGRAVTRFEARWFLQMTAKSICRYRLDGVGNRIYDGHALLTSADLLATDWTDHQE